MEKVRLPSFANVENLKVIEEEEPSVKLGPGETSLHFFQKVYRDPAQPMPRRMIAAKEAVGFEHAKLGAMQVVHANAELLDQTIKQRQAYTQSWFDQNPHLRPVPKQIEATAIEVRNGDQALDPRANKSPADLD